MARPLVSGLRAALGCAAFVPAAALAQMSCAELGTYLETHPHVQQYVSPAGVASPLIALTGTGTSARCEAAFIYSSRGGPAAGYAVGQDQRIGIRVGLPLNSIDGGTGGAQGAWNGKAMNLGGGGLVGGLGQVTSATSAGYVGSATDSGHPSTENPNFAVIQATHELNYGRLDDFLIESLRQQYQWTLALAERYYGMPATRNYWSGCSTGGRQGLSLALSHGDAFDGFLVGAPANYNSRLQVTTLWPWWVNRALVENSITTGKRNAANAAAVAACDVLDGVTDGILGDPRRCKFDARANICGEPGAPAAPNCLTPREADAMNMIWDGPRNDHGRRIWLPFGYGANESVSSNATCGNLGSQCWAHRDTSFDWRPLPLSEFDDETQLATTVVAPYSDIMSTDLDVARERGAKILMWHGGADPLIPWRQAVHYYNDASERYKGYSNLMPWFRFYIAPGVGHCGGLAGPQPQNLFGVLVDWVENAVAPDSILSQNTSGGVVTRSRPLCPYPQTAIFNGTPGGENDAANWSCGGDLENKETICDGLIAPFQHETADELQAVGRRNPAACNANSKVPAR
jgi:hypothetical protein